MSESGPSTPELAPKSSDPDLATAAPALESGSVWLRRVYSSARRWIPRPSGVVILLGFAVLVEAVGLTWVQWQNYLSFIPTQADLGNYNQGYWTTVHGQGFFYYTTNIPGGSPGTLWATHFSPFLLLLLPVYALAQSPVTLLFLKQLALAAGALPVYGIARSYFRGARIPALFAGLFLLSPLTLTTDWNSFDPEVFFPVTFLVALYFFSRGRYWPFLISWTFALATIEAAPVILLLFALSGLLGTFLLPSFSPYWTTAQQRRPLLVASAIAGAWLILAYVSLTTAGPHGGGFGTGYAPRFSVLGATTFPQVIPYALTHPAAAGAALQFAAPRKLEFVELILLSGGAVSVLGGLRYLVPLTGYLTFVLLSNNSGLYGLGTEYSALITPILFAGAIEGTVLIYGVIGYGDAESRHREIRRQLMTEARLLLRQADKQFREEPKTTEAAAVVAALARAVARLGRNELGPAEWELERARVLMASRESHSPGTTLVTDRASDSRPSGGGLTATTVRTPPGKVLPNRREPWTFLPVGIVFVSVLVAFGFANPLLDNPSGGAPGVTFGYSSPDYHDSALSSVLGLIPPGAPVLTTSHLFPMLSDRRNAFVVPDARFLPTNETLQQDLGGWVNQSRFVAIDYVVDPVNAVILRNDTNLSGFGVYAAEGGADLYERGWHGAPSVWDPLTSAMAGGQMDTRLGSTTYELSSTLGPAYFHPPGGTKKALLWTGPDTVYLPLGTYNVTFNIFLSDPAYGAELSLQATSLPAYIQDKPVLTVGGVTYHEAFIRAVSGFPILLGQTEVQTKSALPTPTPMSVTLRIDLTSTGFVNFPGFELSTTMSLFLVSIVVVQTSAI